MNKAPSNGSVIWFLIRPYRWLFSGILLMILLTSLLEGLNIAAFFPMFQSMLTPGDSGSDPLGLFRFLKLATTLLPFSDPILAALTFLVLVTLARVILQVGQTSLIAYASGTAQHDFKNRLLKRYADFPHAFFLENKQGQLIYNITTAASRVGVLCQDLPQLLAEGFKAAVVGTIFLATMPRVAVLLFFLGFAYFWLTRFLSGKVSYHIGKARVVSLAEQTSVATEFFSGIRQIRSFGTEPAWLKKFQDQSQHFRELFIRDAIWVALPKIFLELAGIGLLLGSLFYVRVYHPDQFVSKLPFLAVFAIGLLRFLPCLTQMGQLRMQIVGLLGDAELLHETLTAPVPISPPGNRVFRGLEREIRLDGVHFSYPTRAPLFTGLQLRFEKGRTTAIVGSSGSGKSTLAYLLLGLLEPNRGGIFIDGADLREIEKKSWRSRIGFVPQEMFVAHASVRENITFGRNGFSPADVLKAAETANAAPFVEALPQGFETIVGEKGMKLSGGQQQRIAIARAVLHEPEILIFDEATSFLDAESEKLVQEALERISRDRTVILIAHRLSTVKRADRIVVLEYGKVIEEGNHSELIRGEGRYFQLTTSQIKP